MECADIVYSSIVVKSVVLCDSETDQTDNSLKSDTVETLNVIQNDFDTVETVKTEKHCKLHCGIEVKLVAQSHHIRIHHCLDNWQIQAKDEEMCPQHTQTPVALCQHMGRLSTYKSRI